MVDSFLRLFPRVRDLETLLDNTLAALNRADGEIRTAKQDLLASEAERSRLAQSLQETVAAKSMLEDRLNASQEDRNRLWDLVQESLRGERLAYQMHVNIAWGKEGRSAPYPEAPHLPDHQVAKAIPNSIVPRPRTGTEQMLAKTREFIEDFVSQRSEV